MRRPLTADRHRDEPARLVKHLSVTEARYFGNVFGRPFPDLPPRWWDDDTGLLPSLWATPDESLAEVIDRYRRMWDHSDATIAALGIDAPDHVPWWPRLGRAGSDHGEPPHDGAMTRHRTPLGTSRSVQSDLRDEDVPLLLSILRARAVEVVGAAGAHADRLDALSHCRGGHGFAHLRYVAEAMHRMTRRRARRRTRGDVSRRSSSTATGDARPTPWGDGRIAGRVARRDVRSPR